MIRRESCTKLFVLLLVLLASHVFAQSVQTFSYANPACKNKPGQAAVFSSNWISGGTFTATPAGLGLNATSGFINLNFSSPGLYTVTYSGGSCACVTTATVLVATAPPVGVSGATMCAGSAFPVKVTAFPATGVTYTWLPQNVNTPTLNILSLQQRTLTVRDLTGCTSSTVFNMAVYSLTPTIVGSPSVCLGSSLKLAASGANTFTWNTGAKTAVVEVTPAITTVYTVSGTDSRGCVGSRAHTVAVLPSPAFTASGHTVCAGSTAVVFVSGSTSDISYLWTPGSVKGPSMEITPTISRIYTVTGTRNGCSRSATVPVAVLQSFQPVIDFSYLMPLCTNHTEALPILDSLFTGGGVFSGLNDGQYSGDLQVDPKTGAIAMQGVKAGTYRVTYAVPQTSVAAMGCTAAATGSAIVGIIDPTPLQISSPTTIVEGESARLTVSGGESYEWFPAIALSCTDCAQPLASPVETTTYCVSGVVNGCRSDTCVTVEVQCNNNNDFSVPNAFTPNGDGRNESFCLRGWDRCNRSFSVKVFNRWGEQVYESGDPQFCWDGTSGGALLDADVYVYVIRATYSGQAQVLKSGNITLIR